MFSFVMRYFLYVNVCTYKIIKLYYQTEKKTSILQEPSIDRVGLTGRMNMNPSDFLADPHLCEWEQDQELIKIQVWSLPGSLWSCSHQTPLCDKYSISERNWTWNKWPFSLSLKRWQWPSFLLCTRKWYLFPHVLRALKVIFFSLPSLLHGTTVVEWSLICHLFWSSVCVCDLV